MYCRSWVRLVMMTDETDEWDGLNWISENNTTWTTAGDLSFPETRFALGRLWLSESFWHSGCVLPTSWRPQRQLWLIRSSIIKNCGYSALLQHFAREYNELVFPKTEICIILRNRDSLAFASWVKWSPKGKLISGTKTSTIMWWRPLRHQPRVCFYDDPSPFHGGSQDPLAFEMSGHRFFTRVLKTLWMDDISFYSYAFSVHLGLYYSSSAMS